MQVLPQCGHAVHEDAPDKVSLVLDDCKRTTVRITLDLTEDRTSLSQPVFRAAAAVGPT